MGQAKFAQYDSRAAGYADAVREPCEIRAACTYAPTARAVHPTATAWRAAMPAVRAVVAQLVVQDKLVVTQGGKEVDIRAAKGPIRLKLPPVDGK
jgi:Protein of unknown function (DUF3253)